MMRTIFAMSLALVVGFCSTSEGAAVLPQLDGGPFDGVPNTLTFDVVAGTYSRPGAPPLSAFDPIESGDSFSINYILSGNTGGPVNPNFTLTVVGVVDSAVLGTFYSFNLTNAFLEGPNGVEVNLSLDPLTSVDNPTGGLISIESGGGMSIAAGFSAALGPAITPDSVSFVPVSLPVLNTMHDFVLYSGTTFGGPSMQVSFGTGAITGSSNAVVNPIPEPASIVTLLGCVAGAGLMRARRRRELVAVEAA